MKPRLLLPLTLVILLLVVLVRPVLAHANLLQAAPEANARLERPPAQIELLFSEPIEPSFSTIEVFNSLGNRVDNEDALVDPADPTRMTASLRSLSDGVYTVSWRTLSAVDSHITAGAYPFAVGEVEAAALEAAAQASQQFSVSPGEVLARWLTYLASLALTGKALFVVVVWRPATRTAGLKGEIRPPWRRLASVALLLLVAASLIWLLLQAGQAAGQEIALPWNPAVGQVLFTTRFGVLWLARIALGLLIFWLLQQEGGGPRNYWLAFGAGTLLLLTISLGSHAAAEPEPFLPILSDWLHLIAVSVWVGGLVNFVAAMLASRTLKTSERSRLTSNLIPRFSSLALVSVGVIVLTGVYASILHVGSFEALTTTVYGQALLVKLALFLPMVALGAINLLSTSPKMKLAAETGGKPSLLRRFCRLIRSETMLGATVLFSVAALTTLPPASVPDEPYLGGRQEVDDLEISLEVTPGRPGINTFLVTVTSDGEPELAVREVALQFTPATAELPPSSIKLLAEGEGRHSFQGGSLALPDTWQVQVAVRRLDAFDSFANFELNVGAAGGDASRGGFPWERLAGIFLLAAAVFFWLAVSLLARNSGRTLALGRLPAVFLAFAGLVILLETPVSEQRVETLNPIAPNAASIATGQALYQENCTPCHGVSGAGDGPVGLTLNPPPADLTVHTAPGVHPDARLYDWITNGFPGSVMPAFREQLSDEERWHLVNYIRTLAQP